MKVHTVHDWVSIGSTNYAVCGFITIENVIARNERGEIERDNDGKPIMKRDGVWHTTITGSDGKSTVLGANDKINGRSVQLIPCDVSKSMHAYDRIIKSDMVEVFNDVLCTLRERVTFQSDADAVTTAVWVMAAHFNPIFTNFPRLLIGKPGFNSGGSTLLMVAGCLLPRPIYCVDASEASIYRLIAASRCSLCIDEFRNDLNKKKREAITLLLDSGFAQGGMVPRASGDNFDVELFEHYCPVALVDPDGVVSRGSSLSRNIRIGLVNDPSKSVLIRPADYVEEKRFLIQQLYSLYTIYAHRVAEKYRKIQCSTFTGRALQAYVPLVAVAEILGVTDTIMPTLNAGVEMIEMAKNMADATRRILTEFCQYLNGILPSICNHEKPDNNWTLSMDNCYNVRLTYLLDFLRNELWEPYQKDVSTSDERGTTERIWNRLPQDLDEQLKPSVFAQRLKGLIPTNIGKKSKKDNHICLHFKDADELIAILTAIGRAVGIDYSDVHCSNHEGNVSPQATDGGGCTGSDTSNGESTVDPPRSTPDPLSGTDSQYIQKPTNPLKSDSVSGLEPIGTLSQNGGGVDRQSSQQAKKGDPQCGKDVGQDPVPTALGSIFEACRDYTKSHPGTDRFQLAVAISATNQVGYNALQTLLKAWIKSGKITEDGTGLSFPESGGGHG